MGPVPLHVTLFGAGQVGRALSKALAARGIAHRLLPFRRGLPARARTTELILICVRDGQIPEAARALAGNRLAAGAVVAHVSGLLGPDVLSPLEPNCRAIGQLHPFVSIRSIGHAHDFAGAYFLGDGNRAALATLRRFVRLLGGQFVKGDGVERARYHLAAALLANGSVALFHVASQLLTEAGVRGAVGRKMLLELEYSVLENSAKLGLEAALTGPVRRGDLATIRQHFALLSGKSATTRELYRSLVRSQLEIVRGLGELDARALRRLMRLVRD
jgi:predicted short-subunit dehydrogenase-like oxidoreductase (DUF2520 family)